MKPMIIRSDASNVFGTKVWGPILCIATPLLSLWQEFSSWGVLFASPFFIAAFFGASLAIVELRGDVLRYKRLFKWKTIPEGDIVSARAVWPPFIGSMRLKTFLFPWGRLYFVLGEFGSEPVS